MKKRGRKRLTRTQRLNKTVEKFAFSATRWLGSPISIVIHSCLFIAPFSLVFFGVDVDSILLMITTLVSFEAIYLSIFIQMSVNNQSNVLVEVQEDIEDIQEDVEEIQEDIEDIQEDIEDEEDQEMDTDIQ